MTQLPLHPPSCACCGGGNIEINSQYLDTFSAATLVKVEYLKPLSLVADLCLNNRE